MRVILADHHVSTLWALTMLLHEQPDFDLIGEAVSVDELITVASEQTADLILVDKDLPGGPIEDLITALHAIEPKPIVIAMTSELGYGRRLLSAGADAIVSKNDQPEWLLMTLRRYAHRLGHEGQTQ